jgi:DNA (cytosine-5)-methyltransferase 1
VPARNLPVPDPEPVAEVPEDFLHLQGEHAPHPGTGQGFAALARDQA